MFTLIPWLGCYPPDFSTATLFFCPLELINILWKVLWHHVTILFHLFVHLLTWVRTHGFLFDSLGYDLLATLQNWVLRLSQICSCGSFGVAPVSLGHIPVILRALLCFLAPQDVLRLSCTFSALVLESATAPGSAGSPNGHWYLEAKIWVLGVAGCYRNITVFRFSKWTELGNTQIKNHNNEIPLCIH